MAKPGIEILDDSMVELEDDLKEIMTSILTINFGSGD